MEKMEAEHERETAVLAGELAEEREKSKDLARKTAQLQTGVKERDSVNPRPYNQAMERMTEEIA
jgi:hypothetical protein